MPPVAFRWMTAQEWDDSGHLWLMLHNANEQTGDQRKMSLFAAECCRHHWAYLLPESRTLLDEFEELIDRLSRPSEEEVWKAGKTLCGRANEAVGLVRPLDPETYPLRLAAAKAVCYAVIGCAWAYGYFTELDPGVEARFVEVLRDLFGNPFRPVAIDAAWRTDAVRALAKEAYERRDYSTLPILGDAMEDAGCEVSEILDHCRGPSPHYRGCWVLDQVLGRGVGA